VAAVTRRRSQTEALRFIRALGDVDAGRLRGRCLRYPDSPPVPVGTLHPEAAQELNASVYRQRGEPVTADMIFYVVSSDGTPVAWLTYHARVVTPPATLTTYQLGHQAQAVVALSRLSRRALCELASLRDAREGRTPGTPPTARDDGGYVLVADAADPTLTYWTQLTSDPQTSREHLRKVLGTDGEALIVDTFGYGDYGRHRETFDLPVLCAIERVATGHDLPPCVVGDWLAADGASTATATATATQIIDGFATAYAGIHPTRYAFAEAEAARRGWTAALTAAGIPDRFFDMHRFAGDLFGDQVREVHVPGRGIAVFRRA